MSHLPKYLRPMGLNRRDFRKGIDLPAWFHDEIKCIDKDLYFVWHPFQVIYENVMNQYSGGAEDTRFCINEYCGQEIWGWPLKEADERPIEENRWHLWRLNSCLGWCHVINVASNSPEHLRKVLRELHWQARISEAPMAQKAMVRAMKTDEEDRMEAAIAARDSLFDDTRKENKAFLKEVKENFERGHVKPTNPQKESVYSFPGQKNFTKTVRPLEDREGGLVIPGDD